MASIDTSSAVIDTEVVAQEIAQRSAEQTHTIGEYTSSIRATSSSLLRAGGPLADVAHTLDEQANAVEGAAEGGQSIKIDAALDPHVQGHTKLGGTDSDIVVNATILSDHNTLAETIKHERRHNDQVELKVASQEALLITESGEEVDDELLLQEGDTETHTAKTFGRRDGQPELYARGHDLAEEIQAEHATEWNETLTGHGRVAALQSAIWEKGLRNGTLSMDELAKQAEKTGYAKEAATLMSRHLKESPKSLAA